MNIPEEIISVHFAHKGFERDKLWVVILVRHIEAYHNDIRSNKQGDMFFQRIEWDTSKRKKYFLRDIGKVQQWITKNWKK